MFRPVHTIEWLGPGFQRNVYFFRFRWSEIVLFGYTKSICVKHVLENRNVSFDILRAAFSAFIGNFLIIFSADLFAACTFNGSIYDWYFSLFRISIAGHGTSPGLERVTNHDFWWRLSSYCRLFKDCIIFESFFKDIIVVWSIDFRNIFR